MWLVWVGSLPVKIYDRTLPLKMCYNFEINLRPGYRFASDSANSQRLYADFYHWPDNKTVSENAWKGSSHESCIKDPYKELSAIGYLLVKLQLNVISMFSQTNQLSVVRRTRVFRLLLMLILQLEKSTAGFNAKGNIVSFGWKVAWRVEIENRIADGRQVESNGNAIKFLTD